MDTKKNIVEFDKVIPSLLKVMAVSIPFYMGASVSRIIMKLAYEVETLFELKEELGDDFIYECEIDEKCSRKLYDMLSAIAECKMIQPSPEEWERKKIIEELRSRLNELGIEIDYDYDEYDGYKECWIKIKDIEIYGKDCEIWYRNQGFDVDEVV